MSGFYDEDNDIEINASVKKTIVIAICTVSIIFLVFLVLMYQTTKTKKKNTAKDTTYSEENQDDDFQLSNSGLKSEDLDFWNMFGTNDNKEAEISYDSDGTEGTPAVFTEQGVKPDKIKENSSDEEVSAKWVDGDANDGTHFAITDSDGKKTWYEILDIAKSPYSATFAKNTPSGMVEYNDGSIKSALGADVSSEMGTIDMASVRGSGITYVMIRSHYRDKNTGMIGEDPFFAANAVNAVNAGLVIGLTVDSQALTETEAVEEANYALVSATTADVKYPIAINIPDISDSSNRMSKLSNDQRTKVIKAFCERVKEYGRKPLIHANKSDLIANINIEDLAEYDIWVNDKGDSGTSAYPYFTDYPYKFTMWQYDKGENRCGIVGTAGLDASFVHYEQN